MPNFESRMPNEKIDIWHLAFGNRHFISSVSICAPSVAKKIFLTGAAALLLLTGCQHSNSSSSATVSPSAVIDGSKPFAPLPATARVLKESHLPINFLVGPAGFVRVRDLTTSTELAADSVLSNTVVRVDADFGVYFGSNQTYTKKLDPTHRYQVSVDTTVQSSPQK
jgi:hypothetical protein